MLNSNNFLAALACLTFIGCSGKDEPVEKAPEALSVEVVEVKRGTVQQWTFAEGTARAARREYLTFENAGRITYIKPNLREGDSVSKGETLVRQDQRRVEVDLETARASITEAETAMAVAEADLRQAETEQTLADRTFDRFDTLLKQNSASQQEYDEAKAKADNATANVERAASQVLAAKAKISAAKARLRQSEVSFEETELRAPIDGIVARLNVLEGFYMTPSLVRTDSEEAFLQTVPLLIIDPASLEITVDVPPDIGSTVKAGQETFIQPGGSGSEGTPSTFSPNDFPVRGGVYSVTPSVSPGKRAMQVKIRTTTGAEQLQDGMFVTVWIGSQKREDVVVVPLGVFIYRDHEPYVFIADRTSMQATLRAVTLGLQGSNEQEITAGIEPGDLLVSTGRYQLSDGAPINIIKPQDDLP